MTVAGLTLTVLAACIAVASVVGTYVWCKLMLRKLDEKPETTTRRY